MKKGKPKSSDADKLRQQALHKLRTQIPDLEDLSKLDMQTLIHELQVHKIELETQNEELRQTQLRLERAQARYCDLYDHAPVGYLSLDKKGWILKVNLTAARQLGVDPRQLLKQPLSKYIPEDWSIFSRHLEQVFSTQEPQQCELRFVDRTGIGFYARLDSVVSRSHLDQDICRTIVTDITAPKEAEEKIKNSAQEKEVLLREIHHRVRNNLQIISSLLNIQAMHMGDKRALAIFKDCQQRIQSMALIHENLYRSEDLARIDFGQYLRALIRNAFQFYDLPSRSIKTTIDSPAVILTISQAIPCGLIINEFVTNSLKYAFPSDRGGEITISTRTENKRVIINYQDNGVGLPADLDWQNSPTLGLKLVKLLVKQLHGNIELIKQGKTEFQIEFGGDKC